MSRALAFLAAGAMVFLGIVATGRAAGGQGAAATEQQRTLHVSPSPLASVEESRQFRTIAEAAKAAQPGDTVIIHGGIYRESVVVEKSGTRESPIRFEAARAARVIVTGADRLTEWRREGSDGSPDRIYSAPWPHSFINWNAETHAHPDDEHHRVIGRAEQVFVDDYPLHQVLSRAQMSRGTFFADLENKRLYVWLSTNAEIPAAADQQPRIDASVRNILWESRGDFVQVRGIRFRYAANRAQEAAVQLIGRGALAEDCVFERTNSIGASFTGPDQTARRCEFIDNGQMGFGAARAHNLRITDCLIRNNNIKNFSRGWEAGGDKIVLSRGVVLERSRFIGNRGNGIWFDIGNEDCTVRNCLIADNEDCGIFYEISYGLKAHDNVIIGNGFAAGRGAWGAASGISISSSPGCVIERNLIVGNKEGFNFREQRRTTPRLEQAKDTPEVAVWNHDETIRRNVLAYNRDAQTWGWFDIADERHWPRAIQEAKAETAKPTADIAADYGAAKDAKDVPPGLSLEKLNIRFAENLYAVDEGQGLFHWGTTWKRHERYADVAAVRKALSLEQNSRVAPFVFADYLTRDFRIPRDSPALKMGCYPKGEVPGVRLGVLPQSGKSETGR